MNERIINIKNNIIELIIQQKLLAGVVTLIVLMLISILYLSRATPSPSMTRPTIISREFMPSIINTALISPTIAGANLQNTGTQPHPSNITQDTLTLNQPKTKISAISNTPTSTSPRTGSPVASTANQSQAATTAPTTATQSNINNTTSNNPSSPPKIVFIGPDGTQQTYTPPTNPPTQITWARYTNSLEKYAIDYPSNWQIVTTQYRGHEAIFIYAPGADPNDPNVQYISYGWSSYFYPPDANYTGSFVQDGTSGTIYTNGALESSFIAGEFQYFNGFLVLNNNISDEVFAYIFNHMILSLDFYVP